ncbi:MAG: hypothetical protein AAF787_13635 [Chloroflexota bacterium]
MMPMINKELLPPPGIEMLERMQRTHNETGDEWLSRSQLAEAIGKTQLNGGELRDLEYLTVLKFIESKRQFGDPAIYYRLRT